jgi:protein-tyrosine phosphatase
MPTASDVPESGYIDLHCHLLPGIDDGCRDLEATLDCIRLWQAAGFSGAVCTPHMATTSYPAITPERVAGWVETLRQQLVDAEIDFQLWAGGEVRLGADLIPWFEQHGVPTLGPGRCVLIDWWGIDWPDFCLEACEYLLEHGYQPILAHPERMGLDDAELSAALDSLESLDVWLQGNLNSLAGGEGKTPKGRADGYLLANRYQVLATDTHDPTSTPSRISGLEVVRQFGGEETLDRLLACRTREILQHRM